MYQRVLDIGSCMCTQILRSERAGIDAVVVVVACGVGRLLSGLTCSKMRYVYIDNNQTSMSTC